MIRNILRFSWLPAAMFACGSLLPAAETVNPARPGPRQHWAFMPPVRPALPRVAEGGWADNPIDALIAAEQQRHGLTHQPPADRRIWLRRVYLDLIGLPPSVAQLDAFAADNSPGAVDRVVDRLLDSPQYGERWGRHWMDVWRYSDPWGLGAEMRNSQKHIWHWRDWIIESLNADKGYDQMLREMIAADELYPNDLDRLRASGFLARQYFKFNRTSWLDETIEHTSKAMLGLTFNCCKCHDHKYDPLTQVDYYRLRAVFEPYQVRTDLVPGVSDFEKDGIPRAFDCNLDAKTYLRIRGDERNPDKSRALEPGVPVVLGGPVWKVDVVALPSEAYEPGLRPTVIETYLAGAMRKITAARAALSDARGKLAAAAKAAAAKPGADLPAQLGVTVAEKALAAAEAEPAALRARYAAERAQRQSQPGNDAEALKRQAMEMERLAVLARAEAALAIAERDVAVAAANKKAEAEKKVKAAQAVVEAARKPGSAAAPQFTPLPGARKTLESNLETEASRGKPFPHTSTGRRTALANWLTDRQNPLTARVAVNHIWMRHFGAPLVPTVFDFGRKGTPPTHPELLDWLAVELMEHGWSMKHLHRLMVTSQTYRLSASSAAAAPATLTHDHENRCYWRANPIRMEAETVRDSMLCLAGELDERLGGPPIPVTNDTARRRSLYFVHSHNERQRFLSVFDDASVLDCYRRDESIVPQQALALENSPVTTTLAEKIGQRLIAAQPAATEHEFIRLAFLTVLCVEPTAGEEAAAAESMSRLTEAARRRNRPNPEVRARISLIHALLNHNDFITIR